MAFSQFEEHASIETARSEVDAAWSNLESKGLILATNKCSADEWLARIVVHLRRAMPEADIPSLAARQFLATVPTASP